MITELALSLSANLFEHLIERALPIALSTVLNIAENGPSRTAADEFKCFDVTGALDGNTGGAGTSADGAA
jgi:hypothetical protein